MESDDRDIQNTHTHTLKTVWKNRFIYRSNNDAISFLCGKTRKTKPELPGYFSFRCFRLLQAEGTNDGLESGSDRDSDGMKSKAEEL